MFFNRLFIVLNFFNYRIEFFLLFLMIKVVGLFSVVRGCNFEFFGKNCMFENFKLDVFDLFIIVVIFFVVRRLNDVFFKFCSVVVMS